MDGDVAGLGEFGLIAAVTARLPQGDDVLLGPGDDAAVVRVADGRVVATTDLLVEGRHFRQDWSSPYDVGRKAAAANLADVAAMGARPLALLVGLAAPADLPAAEALALTDGLRDEAGEAGASVVGGDVVQGVQVVVAVTALGTLDGRAPVRRSGARPGDVVAVSGRLGWSAAGLALLAAGAAGVADPLVRAHVRPAPPYGAGVVAALAGAHAMCDVSDGLLQDLGHVAAASEIGIVVDPAALPVGPELRAAAARLGADPVAWVLTGGEDHALVACFAPRDVPRDWTVAGRVVTGSGVRAGGYERGPGGWQAFSG